MTVFVIIIANVLACLRWTVVLADLAGGSAREDAEEEDSTDCNHCKGYQSGNATTHGEAIQSSAHLSLIGLVGMPVVEALCVCGVRVSVCVCVCVCVRACQVFHGNRIPT